MADPWVSITGIKGAVEVIALHCNPGGIFSLPSLFLNFLRIRDQSVTRAVILNPRSFFSWEDYLISSCFLCVLCVFAVVNGYVLSPLVALPVECYLTDVYAGRSHLTLEMGLRGVWPPRRLALLNSGRRNSDGRGGRKKSHV